MKLLYTLLIMFITALNSISAQDYSKADEHARSIPKTKNLEQLSAKLTTPYTDTLLKYRAIFTWVAENIKYDCDAFHNPDKGAYSAEDVLRKGKSVCSGYSNLFEELCKQSGLECVTIDGWSKSDYGSVGRNFSSQPSHAWNAIKLNGEWKLCDPTWGAGYIEGNCEKFNKRFEDFFFCTPPELFALQHYPKDTSWFLGASMSETTFQNFPFFDLASLKSTIKLQKPAKGTIKFNKSKSIDFEFSLENMHEPIYVVPLGATEAIAEIKNEPSGTYSFSVNMKKYKPYLVLYFGTEGALVYKVER